MEWMEPKVNWKPSDYYNAVDLNRIENNIEVMANLVNLHFGNVEFNINKSRDFTSIEFADSLNRIESNIELLKKSSKAPQNISIKQWKYNDSFDYRDANRLETNLLHLFCFIKGNIDSFKYCGSYYCGEDVI